MDEIINTIVTEGCWISPTETEGAHVIIFLESATSIEPGHWGNGYTVKLSCENQFAGGAVETKTVHAPSIRGGVRRCVEAFEQSIRSMTAYGALL